MKSLLDSTAPGESPWKRAVLDWTWSNIPLIAVVLTSITCLSGLAWIILRPAHAPAVFREICDSSLELTGTLIGLYVFAFFFDISKAKEFWMNKEMGFYIVAASLFFATGVHDLRLFVQDSRWDRGVSEELIALGLLWTSQFWKNDSAKGVFSSALGFHGVQDQQASEIIQLGLSPDPKSQSNPPVNNG